LSSPEVALYNIEEFTTVFILDPLHYVIRHKLSISPFVFFH